MIAGLLFTFFLILLNGFFVSAEFALVKVRQSQIDLLVQQGSKAAKFTKHILAHLDAYLSACQLGITLASLALGWIGEDVFATLFERLFATLHISMPEAQLHTLAIVGGFALITMGHIVIGEQVPKIMAIGYARQTSLFISIPLRIFYIIFRPFIRLLNSSSNLVLSLLGIPYTNEEHIHTEEELKVILHESEQHGHLEHSSHELIHNIFRFDDRLVREVMIPRSQIFAIDITQPQEEILEEIIKEGYSRVPVYEESMDEMIGVLHTKDLIRYMQKDEITKKDIKSVVRKLHVIPETQKIQQTLRDFQLSHSQIALVKNEYGENIGLITMEDVLEELIGEIHDEHDQEKPDLYQAETGERYVQATAKIDELNEVLPFEIPLSDEYETIGGWVMTEFGRIPTVGESFGVEGYEISVQKITDHVLQQLKISLQQAPRV